ncbi:hypothetical protein [Bradyrhizobium valentinum]|uniref:hypothetical protein n=1 Tax=Bradyrhizobium valentinum TaxID=1518501 RepID=UPI001AECA797|nr:hypothetical protein [Bradyrhizobium valentinum]
MIQIEQDEAACEQRQENDPEVFKRTVKVLDAFDDMSEPAGERLFACLKGIHRCLYVLKSKIPCEVPDRPFERARVKPASHAGINETGVPLFEIPRFVGRPTPSGRNNVHRNRKRSS